MRNWGIGLLICGGLAIVGIISEPQEDYKEGLFGTAVFLVGGGYLYNKGQKTSQYYERSCRIFS